MNIILTGFSTPSGARVAVNSTINCNAGQGAGNDKHPNARRFTCSECLHLIEDAEQVTVSKVQLRPASGVFEPLS